MDKDAIIEIVDGRVEQNRKVLGRKALMVTASSPIQASPGEIIVRINNSESTRDDYLTLLTSY
jgi:hypothetical protein